MSVILRNFIFSCNFFHGFRRTIDVNIHETNNDIVSFMINELEDELKKGHFEILLEKLNEIKSTYHIHCNFGTIILEDKDYYICSGGH